MKLETVIVNYNSGTIYKVNTPKKILHTFNPKSARWNILIILSDNSSQTSYSAKELYRILANKGLKVKSGKSIHNAVPAINKIFIEILNGEKLIFGAKEIGYNLTDLRKKIFITNKKLSTG